MRVARANDELHALRMGERQRWPDFYATRSNKLTEALGNAWDDANKIWMLQNALNNRLITTLARNHLLPEVDFDDWVRIVGPVAQQLEVLEGWNRHLKESILSEFPWGNLTKINLNFQKHQNNHSKIDCREWEMNIEEQANWTPRRILK